MNEGFPTPEEFPKLVARNIIGTMPIGWVHRQLANGRALVLIDGLDEVPEKQRKDMLKGIEDIVSDYPLPRYVITSRPHAIKNWPVWKTWTKEENFTYTTLQRMDSNSIYEFIDNWHRAFEVTHLGRSLEINVQDMAENLKGILDKRPHLRRLATNPLLCAMICSLYAGRQQSLPEERIKLYEECVEMLIERRDIGRKISVKDYPEMSYYQKIELIQEFAHWMMRNGYSSVTVNEADEHLNNIMPESLREMYSGKDVIRFYIERSNLLRMPVEGLIDFTHRTFQEFLTAQAIIKYGDIGLLIKNALDDQWRETTILSSGIAGVQRPDDRKKLLEKLVKRANKLKSTNNKNKVLSLAIACLENEVGLDAKTKAYVIDNVVDLFPPKDEEEAKLISKAGDPAVDLLIISSEQSEKEIAMCLKTLAMIGTKKALDGISNYANDERSGVLKEIGRAWKFFNEEEYTRRVLKQNNTLYLDRDASTDALKQLNHLESLIVINKNFSDIQSLTQLDNLQTLDLSKTGVTDLTPLAQLNNLQTLDLDNTGVTDLTTLAQLNNLQSLKLRNTEVTDLTPLEQLNNLRMLTLMETGVTDLSSLVHLNDLQWLELDSTRATDLTPLAQLNNLKALYLNNTGVTELTPLAQLNNLQTLLLMETGVVDLTPLAQLNNLQMLDLDNTGVTDLTPLAQLNNLQMLDIRNTKVTDLTPLAQLNNLENLHLSNTRVTDLTPLANLISLQTLGLMKTGVTDLTPLTKLNKLQLLILDSTGVKDLTPLAQLNKLEFLDLSNTKVTDLTPLAQLNNLRNLFLTNTGVTDLTPLAQLNNLQMLFLDSTGVIDLTPVENNPGLRILRE